MIDFKKLREIDYWGENYFVITIKMEIINQLQNLEQLEKIKKNGSKLDLSYEKKKEYIVNDLEDCLDYIQYFNDNGHDIKLEVEQIVNFTIESIAEAMKEYIENGYKSKDEEAIENFIKNELLNFELKKRLG